MFTKILWRVLIVALLSLFISSQISYSSDLVPLYPKGQKKQNNADNRLHFPPQSTDPVFTVQHVDDFAEYYLGSGAADDTFFVTFEPPAPCSVRYAEIEWFDQGNVNAFAAWYSDEAHAMYPDGLAPNRGTSPVSPIGDWIAGPVPNMPIANQNWELLDLGGTEFICGDPITLETDIFGVGFIKGAEAPHPLADKMDSKGIRYTYTWFGGPWMSTYPEDWGAYSSDLTNGTVIEVMMRVWVSYPWGMPIQISNVSQHCNTFNLSGPYTITCELLDDDPGITPEDIVEVVYTVNAGPEQSVPLTETAPGSGIFSADIPGQPVGSALQYWIYCVDDTGLETQSQPRDFEILAPENPDADLLLFNEGINDRLTAYTLLLDELEVSYEMWDVEENNGFDESVVNYGWNSILAAGWGISSIPCLNEPNPLTGFLDNGGNLALIDQDWFYANMLPAEIQFFFGDFAYDYIGLDEAWNDYDVPDINYYGQGGDPITDPWENTPYETYWDESGIHMDPANLWADWFAEGAAENIFYGENDGNSYGCRYENGFKTVFMSFMAEANCYIDPQGYWTPSADFTQLLTNILTWFEVPLLNQMELSETEIDFGEAAVGNQAQHPLTIHNLGGAALNLFSAETAIPEFSTSFTPVTIPPFGETTITVFFAPSNEEFYSDILTITGSAETETVELTGEGVINLEVILTPYSPPICIPENGGSFNFNIAVNNQTNTGMMTDLWTEIELPGVGTVGPLISVENLFLPPSASIDRDRSQTVPSGAPAGVYQYYAYYGNLPWVVDGYDCFEFTKLGDDNSPYLGEISDWLCAGQSFDDLAGQPVIVESFRLNEPYPNPFNPETTLSFELPEASIVSLSVFDIQGRKVVSLVDGYRNEGIHEIVFDASSLSSGVYFAVIHAGDFNQTRKLLLIK